jgi:ribonuclease P protein component
MQRVHAEGKRIRTSHVDVRVLASLRAYGRVGVVVPKYGHTAVERNTVKRRLREAIRLRLLPALGAVDLVVRATPAAYRVAMQVLADDVATLATRLPRREHQP